MILVLMILLKNPIYGQIKNSAPKFEFSGTKVDWVNRPLEVSNAIQVGKLIDVKEQLGQHLSHIIDQNRVYYLLDNVSYGKDNGSTLVCYDIHTGDSLWQRNYNRSHNDKHYGYTYFFGYRLLANDLELFGRATIDTVLYNIRDYYPGFLNRRLVSKDGEDLIDFTNNHMLDRVVFISSLPPHYIGDNWYAFYYETFSSIDTNHTDIVVPSLWDDTLHSKELTEFTLKFSEPNTVGIRVEGPVQVSADTFIYFAWFQNFSTGKFKHYMWKVNNTGYYWDLKDVTNIIGDSYYFRDADKIDQSIRIRTQKIVSRETDVGYLFIDFDGKMIKDQRDIKFDNRPASHIVSTRVKGSDDYLHIIKHQRDNNIYFYRENQLGELLRSGTMQYNGNLKYGFIPRFVQVADQNDIVLSFVASLDSILAGENYVLGGWPYICKIEAKKLGLPTDIFDVTDQFDLFQLYPNPASSHLVISTEHRGEIEIYNLSAQKLKQQSIQKNRERIDLTQFPSGMYILKMKAENGQIQAEKFVVEKRE